MFKNKKYILLLLVSIGTAFCIGFVAGDKWYPRNPSDLNHDGVVNVYDLSIFAKNYPKSKEYYQPTDSI